MKVPLFMILVITAGISTLQAKEAIAPAIETISEDEYKIGKILINKKTKEISFGAGLNMKEGLLEYAVVLTKGKVHESLFLTDISPTNLNVALKLLNFQESAELFEILDEDYNPSGKFPVVSEEVKKSARLDIFVRWKEGDKEKTTSLNRLIFHAQAQEQMLTGPWLYTGSYIHEGKYKAELDGDIIAIYNAQPAMINYPGKDRYNDDVWVPNKELLPNLDTHVTIILKPHSGK